MKAKSPFFVVNFDLSRLADAGKEISLKPTPEQRIGLAGWAGVDSVETLNGVVHLKRLGVGHFSYEAHFTADVVQACVVTLAPVRSHIEREFQRFFQVADVRRAAPVTRAIELPSNAIMDDEEPEILSSPVLDIAAPVLEELALAIDPYPRALGVAFKPPPDDKGSADSPFAVLKKLKIKR
jgi:uncharacterized metal-binding protein YceD (DUF177 family)